MKARRTGPEIRSLFWDLLQAFLHRKNDAIAAVQTAVLFTHLYLLRTFMSEANDLLTGLAVYVYHQFLYSFSCNLFQSSVETDTKGQHLRLASLFLGSIPPVR
jgi:hypothetical protein